MQYGNYWNDDQVVVARVGGTDEIPHGIFKGETGTPAFIAVLTQWDNGQKTTNYLFVEIVPGTEHEERFLNLSTNLWEHGTCAKIQIYKGATYKFEEMKLLATDSWPLAWFKLKEIPRLRFDAHAAYERAMSIIGK
jgi:hypothetical protein